jgi:hypothetical protein
LSGESRLVNLHPEPEIPHPDPLKGEGDP